MKPFFSGWDEGQGRWVGCFFAIKFVFVFELPGRDGL